MANIHDCLQRAVDAGELDQVRATEAKSEYDQLVERYVQAMPRHQAEATAALHLKEATSKARRSRRHMVLNQLQAMVRIRDIVENAPDPGLALKNLIEHSDGSGVTGESIKSLTSANIRSVNAALNDVLRETGQRITGSSRDIAKLRDLVRELHGEATGNARAAELAVAVRGQQTRLRQLFNAHGGDIGEIADYGLPHAHDVSRIRRAGFDAWADEITPRLDWNRMVDLRTAEPFAAAGQIPGGPRVREFLRDIYDGIATRGWDDREPSLSVGGRALYNRHSEARVLHFRDGSNWLEYNAKFGTSDPFSAMIGGLHGLARDVAMMRILGPNPKAGLEYAIQVAQKRASGAADPKLEARIQTKAAAARTMLAHVSGAANMPASEGWASFFSGTRHVLTSIQLGGAAISSVTDLQTMRMAASVMGMSRNNVVARHVRLMFSKASRETAARAGYVADTLADTASTVARWTGEAVSGAWATRLSGFTMRASLLSFWTDMGRIAFQMEFAGHLAENAGRSFEAIDAPLRQLFRERGITAQDWDLLRAEDTLFRTDRGETFLSPIHWLNAQTTLPQVEAEGLAMRLQMAMEEQLDYAIPTASVEGRAFVLGQNQPGTFAGEVLRSTLMYRSYPVTLMVAQYRRFLSMPTGQAKAAYAARMSVGLLLLGGLAVQLKEMAKGNDPRPMDDAAFWGAAFFQGGGAGIFGDFIVSETSRAGGGIGETLSGAVAGLASDVVRPVVSNIARGAEGKELLLGRDLANFIRRNTPVASSLWYARLAYDRLVADTLQDFLDPDAETQWRREQRRRAKDYGTQPFWPRGDKLPARAPDLSNALGGQP